MAFTNWFSHSFNMEWTVLCCVLFAVCLSIQAEPVASSPQENRSLHPDPVALFNSGRPERLGEFLLLKDFMNQGDSLLKERLKESYSNLKEMLKEGDSVLKEHIVEGVAQVKEQLKEGYGRLKEELNEDVAWLKDKLAKGQTRMKEELAEEEAQMKEELAEQRDAFEKLKDSVKQQLKSSSDLMDDLNRQMSDVQAELKNTKLQQNSTQTELRTTQESLQSTQETLQSTRSDLHTTHERVKKTEDELQRTREQLQEEVEASTALKAQLLTAEDEIHSLKNNSLQSSLQHSLLEASEVGRRDFSAIGSTFIRWGRTECPDNTSLVYSGVAGGALWKHTGGGSNYLCLVMDPQLDNTTVPKLPSVNYLYGAEYEDINGHHDQDIVCSVCRAPQTTTLMIPATLTCPLGWTTQYKGHLVSEKHDHSGRTEYVCLDEVREHRDGGHENKNGALMYYVVAECGSLPCPPYVNGKVVTCVVCSM